MKKYVTAAALLTLAGLGFRLFLALHLPSDEPDDGRLYARIATNILEHRSYSIETEEPYSPTLIRVPGYPLFLAGIYALFGHENNRAVRVTQAALDSITCWLIALLALAWAPAAWDGRKRRRLLIVALALAVACPFGAIYVTTILTETCTTLLAVGCALLATLAMKTNGKSKTAGLWILAGFSGGLATLFRPDSAFFVAAVGLTLVIVGLYRVLRGLRRGDRSAPGPHGILARTGYGVALTLGFAIALAPWTIRNVRVFGIFQPIAPQYANMPGEFVPSGYIAWLRTWVDDVRYTELLEFPLDEGPLHIEHVPEYAFGSPEDREKVAALFDRYNNAHATPPQPAPSAEPKMTAPLVPPPDTKDKPSKSTVEKPPLTVTPPEPSEEPSEEAESEEGEADAPDEPEQPASAFAGEMTPEIDAGFGEIARARIARNPVAYYFFVPLKRACSLWFDTHSQYYTFQGELLPLSALDMDIHQQYWLPLFMLLTIVFSLLGLAGGWVLWRDPASRRWVLLLALLIIPRLAFLTSMENPEPRYVVEFFAFVIAAGSLSFTALIWDRARKVWGDRRAIRRDET